MFLLKYTRLSVGMLSDTQECYPAFSLYKISFKPQMDLATDLIQSYVGSGLLPSTVRAWYSAHQPSAELLSLVAESIGAAFLARKIDFETANGLMNQLMPCVGFDSAPLRFWQYYVAFEENEVSGNPNEDARPAVHKVANAAVA